MKILLANKFYYRRGGECIYTMNLEKMLKGNIARRKSNMRRFCKRNRIKKD